jgi:hypothetical protein
MYHLKNREVGDHTESDVHSSSRQVDEEGMHLPGVGRRSSELGKTIDLGVREGTLAIGEVRHVPKQAVPTRRNVEEQVVLVH